MDFYSGSSVSKELLTRSINNGKSITTMEEEVITTVFQPGNHFYLTKPVFGLKRITQVLMWQCEAMMGLKCVLVRPYLLNLLTKEFGKNNIGLYRDDGLSRFQNYFRSRFRESKK